MRRNTTNLSRFWSHHSSEGIHAASQVEVVRFLLKKKKKKTSLLCAQVLALVCFIAGVLFCAFSNFYMVLYSDFLLAADILGHSLWSFADCISAWKLPGRCSLTIQWCHSQRYSIIAHSQLSVPEYTSLGPARSRHGLLSILYYTGIVTHVVMRVSYTYFLNASVLATT